MLAKSWAQAPANPAGACPVTVSAPEEMVRPDPVISVMAASEATLSESVTVDVAFRDAATLKGPSKEEDARTMMPERVFVGESRFKATVSHAPAKPVTPASVPQ